MLSNRVPEEFSRRFPNEFPKGFPMKFLKYFVQELLQISYDWRKVMAENFLKESHNKIYIRSLPNELPEVFKSKLSTEFPNKLLEEFLWAISLMLLKKLLLNSQKLLKKIMDGISEEIPWRIPQGFSKGIPSRFFVFFMNSSVNRFKNLNPLGNSFRNSSGKATLSK